MSQTQSLIFPNKLEGKRIVLMRPEPISMDLAAEIYAEVDASRDFLRPWLPWVDSTHSVEDELVHYLYDYVSKKWKEGVAFPYLIRHKETQQLLGSVDIMHVDMEHKSGEIGYWLSQKATGFGYMTEAVSVLESKAFELGLNRIVIRNDTRNLPSVGVAKRSGYRLEGVLRQDTWLPDQHKWRDTNLWSKLKSEWSQAHSKD